MKYHSVWLFKTPDGWVKVPMVERLACAIARYPIPACMN